MTVLLESKSKKTKNLALNLLMISILFMLAHLTNEITSNDVDSSSWIDSVIILILILCSIIVFYSTYYYNLKSLDAIKNKNDLILNLEAKNKLIKEELTKNILAQFNEWHLTSAESEVAMLLIKGFSTQEISVIRNASDRTVRKQATEIYRKTNQQGRATLAAFFLEDLL